MTEWLIAPPGTPPRAPGWHKPEPGTILTWDINGVRPAVAVKRDGVLVATGLAPDDWGSKHSQDG